MTAEQDAVLLVFTRAPVPGRVKTRLVPVLGAARAAALHNYLLRRTLETARRSALTDIELWCAPTARHRALSEYARRFALTPVRQRGGDLGERMRIALRQALGKYRHAVLVGSDCADLAAADLDLALAQLRGGCDLVLGPTRDGGYYLAGMSRLHEPLFSGIDWGSGTVLRRTRARAARLQLKVCELPRRRDIDRPRDLAHLAWRPPAWSRNG